MARQKTTRTPWVIIASQTSYGLLRFMGRLRHTFGNGNCYYNDNRILAQFDDMDLEDMWFQQDGSTSHTVNVTLSLLETKFGERVISFRCPMSRSGSRKLRRRRSYLTKWSCRLAASVVRFDAVRLLWSYVKSMVYASKPATIDELRTNIECKIAAVSADLWLKIVKNWFQHLDFCKRARGGHANEIEFHS